MSNLSLCHYIGAVTEVQIYGPEELIFCGIVFIIIFVGIGNVVKVYSLQDTNLLYTIEVHSINVIHGIRFCI